MDNRLAGDVVAESGRTVRSVKRVTSSTFQVVTDEGVILYVKGLPENRINAVDILLSSSSTSIVEGELIELEGRTFCLTEAACGSPLAKVLPLDFLSPFYKRRLQDRKAALEDLGMKLSLLHKLPVESSSATADWKYVDRWGALNNEQISSPARQLLENDQSRTRLERIITEIDNLPGQSTVIHGDPNLRHIYIKDDTVTLIDLDAAKSAPDIVDRAIFYCALRLMIGRFPHGSHSIFESFWEAFENGYTRRIELPPRIWNTVCIIRLLSLYLYYQTRDPLPLSARMMQVVDSWIIKRAVQEHERVLHELV